MTHQNHQTNGASLEDCHTNFFALTDLCGIKWRKLVLGERLNTSGDPLDDPVLRSYSRCLAVDILCVWRRVAASKPEPDQPGNIFELSLPVSGNGGSVIHPPLSLTAAKELWIFWYGEEPDLTDLLAPELLKSSEGGGQGSWESGITYECRSLLFKALHNLIERCLLSKDVVRLGRWFVQPCSNNECTFGKSSHHLSFSFAFFVHGESTVCASMDLRVHPAVRPLTPEYLAKAVQQPGNNDAKPKPVILAPFGLAATLTGQSFRALDPITQKAFDDWSLFYPLCNKENNKLPPMVEVISGGVKMRYPSKYVLVTDLDDEQFEKKCNTVPPVPISEKAINDLGHSSTMHNPIPSTTTIPERVWQECIANPVIMCPASITTATTLSSPTRNNGGGGGGSTTLNIKEEPNNEMVGTTTTSSSSSSSTSSASSTSSITTTATTSPSKFTWDYTDPTQKMSCSCTKCRKQYGRTTQQNMKTSSRTDKAIRTNRIPFHKRQDCLSTATSISMAASNQISGGSGAPSTPNNNNNTNSNDSFVASLSTTTSTTTSTASQRSTDCSMALGGLYSRNPHSIPESLTAIPSVGSPGSAGPSPHPNSTLSQPTSIPPADQLLAVISPIQPTSALNIQPSTPLNDHLDKNTPAATPTDQHDSKSTTASPYVAPAPPSVEPPVPLLEQQLNATQLSIGKIKTEPLQMNVDGSNNGNETSGGNNNGNTVNNTSTSSNMLNSSNGNGSCSTTSANSSINMETKNFITLLKRPLLASRDYENIIDDDYLPNQLLYDYSTLEAWMNHPVKRYKPNEDTKIKIKQQFSNRFDLYATKYATQSCGGVGSTIKGEQTNNLGGTNSGSSGIGAMHDIKIKTEIGAGDGTNSGTDDIDSSSSIMQLNEIKKEPDDGDENGKILTENLFTSEGLQASYKDLDQLFDEENSGSPLGLLQVQTPPGSNKSIGGLEDVKRCINSNNLHSGILRPEELSKMFPTPPSLEHHPNSSPCGGAMSDQQLDIMETPNLGSPIDEPIDDWSYVFLPPTFCKFVGSSKYAPLTNLPSQSQPLSLPPNCIYKPSWQQQQQQQQQQISNSSSSSSNNNNNSNTNNQNHPEKGQLPATQSQVQSSISLHQQQPPPPPLPPQHQMMNVPNLGFAMLTPNQIPRPTSATSISSGIGGNGGSLPGNNNMMNYSSGGSLGASPGLPMNSIQQHAASLGLRPDMSPISPATSAMNVSGGGIVGAPPYGGNPSSIANSPLNPYRRNALPPPPPYEVAIASPATSTSSYLNKQFNSHEPVTPSLAIPNTTTAIRIPEANALLLNVLLYDTALNLFKDHNFDSCTLCVCNAGQKCVGNIRGSDSGVYLALPGSSFNPASLYTSNNNNSTNNNNNNNCYSGGINYGMDSPAGMLGTQHNTGYLDEDPIKCSCGFSSVVNRRLAHRSGLFFEDELEITGMAEDPVNYRRNTQFSYILGGKKKIESVAGVTTTTTTTTTTSNNKNSSSTPTGGSSSTSTTTTTTTTTTSSSSLSAAMTTTVAIPDRDNCDTLSQMMMDLLQEQCCLVQSSSSSIQRTIRCFKSLSTTNSIANAMLNMLEYTDAQDIICLALDQSRLVHESQFQNRMEMGHYQFKAHKYSISVHKWPYVKAEGPRGNKDIVRVMKSMQPLLQDAFHKKCTTRLWDAPYTVQGPLTWRQFHRMASSSSGQCEPQPIPSVVVGHEKDWLSVSPYAIQYWDKLLLEPYSYARDVAYIIIAPDNDYIIGKAKSFFKELSTTYEMCKLGRHNPMKGWDGILRVSKSAVRCNTTTNNNNNAEGLDEWFSSLGDSKTSELLKLYAQTCQQHLVPYLSKIPSDKSLLDPPEGLNTNNSSASNKDRSLPSPMLPPSTPESSHNSSDKAPSTPKSSDADSDSQRDSLNNSTNTPPTVEPLGIIKDEINPPCIVIYVIDPFSAGFDPTQEISRIACLALLRCYSNILTSIPESVRSNINYQIISLESVMELGRTRDRYRISDEMRCLALSIFSQCRRHIAHNASVKSLTGFGTAANMELFLKNKDEKNRAAYKLYTPPYILSGRHEKSENTETFGTTNIEQQSSIMYCSYCLSEDQRWLLAVATDDRGELLETITINIDIPNRRRRKKASARRLGLQKLMDFMIGVISQSGQPWRIVVGRIGRIGHGELKGWSWLLSKQNLMKASKQLKDICEQCSLMNPHAVPSILSACLVTLEPDSNLRVMPDQFTPDERFSQISMQSPLSTPQDVTCTHILVFPTSAKAQSSQSAFQEQHINGFLDEEELFGHLDGEDGIDDVNMNVDDIFGNDWENDIQMPHGSPERSRHGSPNGMEDNRSRQSPGAGGGNCGSGRNNHMQQDSEEVGQLLQQPLALGYLVSTAPTGRMPAWFWSSCPHLENVCPVFLKTALHLHSPSIQQNTDDILHPNQSANVHPLDSGFTADVLRYVLEGYNVLSWLSMDSNTHDRLSCLPIHVQVLMQLYHMTAAMA